MQSYANVHKMRRMNPAQAITALLERADWTEVRIAAAVGTTQPTVNRIKRGASPSYQVGTALVALAAHEGLLDEPSQQVA